MSTPRKTFTAHRGALVEPIEFEIADVNGVVAGTFRATPKPRLDIVQRMADAVQLWEGQRRYNATVLTDCLRDLLVKQVWDTETEAWVQADDRQRFDELLVSDEWLIPIDTLGEIVMWLVEETTGHPTGGPSRSSGGPGSMPTTSPVVSPSPVSTGPTSTATPGLT